MVYFIVLNNNIYNIKTFWNEFIKKHSGCLHGLATIDYSNNNHDNISIFKSNSFWFNTKQIEFKFCGQLNIIYTIFEGINIIKSSSLPLTFSKFNIILFQSDFHTHWVNFFSLWCRCSTKSNCGKGNWNSLKQDCCWTGSW